jgi:4,5:9,10-diseco-3-hydroxy-5,9,17-trioxoandrosta-1(10),2-diene-4-oate hydrolase
MDSDRQAQQDKYVTVDGLRLRYIEAGQGPAVLFLHGASLGSSADVFRRNLPAFANAGFRPIAFDMPGFGRSEAPADHSLAYRRSIVPKLMDALDVTKAAIVGHSQAGTVAVALALQQPGRISHVIVLGTGSLLPPLPGSPPRPERNVPDREPSLADTRAALEATLVHRELATEEEVALRHSYCTDGSFAAALARASVKETREDGPPLWQRLTALPVPLLMIYGRQDRAQAAERAALLKEKFPQLDLQMVDNCHHLVPWDAADEFQRLAIEFLKR